MPKQRDYKAEYQRRMASGKSRGLSPSQASGHPKKGEYGARKVKRAKISGFRNPFSIVKDSISRMIDNFQNFFGRGGPSGNEIEYIERVGDSGINTIPRWSIGSTSEPMNLKDFNRLYDEVRDMRFQSSYTVVVCGYLEETYPGHDDEEPIECLSYRWPVSKIEYVMSQNPQDITEFMNISLPSTAEEHWLQVNEVQILDKE